MAGPVSGAGARVLLAVALGAASSACEHVSTGTPAETPVETEYVTMRRAWLPGERDSLIARIQRTRQLDLPYVGDLSDLAADLIPADSAVEIVPAAAVQPAVTAGSGPARVPHVPGTGWTTVGLDLRMINTDPAPDDTLRWLGWMWFRTADSTNKGLAFGYRALSAGNTLPATFVNTTTFDAAFGKSGAGSGEVSGLPGPSLTYWQGNGWVRRNTVSMSLNFAISGASAITTGPYLGGSRRTALMNGVLDSVRLDRVTGTGTPVTQYASITLTFVGGVQITCVFPTPCTTNALMAPEARAWLAQGAAAARDER